MTGFYLSTNYVEKFGGGREKDENRLEISPDVLG